jgi:hypothetical protein
MATKLKARPIVEERQARTKQRQRRWALGALAVAFVATIGAAIVWTPGGSNPAEVTARGPGIVRLGPVETNTEAAARYAALGNAQQARINKTAARAGAWKPTSRADQGPSQSRRQAPVYQPGLGR